MHGPPMIQKATRTLREHKKGQEYLALLAWNEEGSIV